VLIPAYNAGPGLKAALASVLVQTLDDLEVIVADDGSRDETRTVLSAEAARWEAGRFDIVDGPKDGFAENFRSLVLRAGRDADFYAFCDQDDLWEPDKLETAAARLATCPASQPAVYCGATRTLLEDGSSPGTSPIMRRTPSFRNALVQSIAGGNTMVMNRAAFDLVRRACEDVRFVSHDWWVYIVVSGAGGTVIYDPVPRVSYRQHGGNLVGSNASIPAKLRRVLALFGNRYRAWHDVNLAALRAKKGLLSAENAAIVEEFDTARAKGGVGFALANRRLGLYRQSVPGNVMLFLGAILGKI